MIFNKYRNIFFSLSLYDIYLLSLYTVQGIVRDDQNANIVNVTQSPLRGQKRKNNPQVNSTR